MLVQLHEHLQWEQTDFTATILWHERWQGSTASRGAVLFRFPFFQ
jgi:hypothetical protein